MTRYIDADRFERVLLSMGEDNICNECCMAVIEKLDAQPTAEVRENVKGSLIEPYLEEYYGEWYHCSVCGSNMQGGNFCNECGADLRGEENER